MSQYLDFCNSVWAINRQNYDPCQYGTPLLNISPAVLYCRQTDTQTFPIPTLGTVDPRGGGCGPPQGREKLPLSSFLNMKMEEIIPRGVRGAGGGEGVGELRAGERLKTGHLMSKAFWRARLMRRVEIVSGNRSGCFSRKSAAWLSDFVRA